MPTLSYDKKDLLSLIGKNLSDEELEEIINSIKPSVEKITDNEIIIEHTPDRIDLFGIEGLARAVKSYLGIETGLKKYFVEEANFTIKVESVPVRPYIAAAIVKNVDLKDETIKSLMNIQEVLHETIGRKRRKVAIGIHDLNKISPPIKYTQTSKESKILPLEYKDEMSLKEVLQKISKGKEYGYLISKSKLWPVYEDALGIFSFPPIINSERTKVTEKTKNLFIELTGTEKNTVKKTLNIIVTNLAERGGIIQGVRLEYDKKTEITPNLNEDVMELDIQYANKWIGLNLSQNDMIKLLERMGYAAIGIGDNKIEVIIPAYRADILHPIDIIEDIAISYGYNNLIPELPNIFTIGRQHPLEKFSGKIRYLLVGLGFQEIIQPVISNFKDQFEKMNLKKQKIVTISNPVSESYNCLRISLIPSLLKSFAANKHVEYPQKIFEIGDVVIFDDREETMTKNIRTLGSGISDTKANFADISATLEALMKSLNFEYDLIAADNPSFIKGRVAEIYMQGKRIGIVGEINPKVLENWNLEMPVAVFELNLEEIFTLSSS